MDDRIRYLGAAGYASINLKFHGIGDGTPLDDFPEQFNIQGLFILQDIKLRLWDSDFFAGGRYQYLGANVDFDDVEVPAGVNQDQLDSTVSQLGVLLGYDSRDNIFSLNRGIKADFEAMFAEKAIGSEDTKTTVGGGFRYLIARKLGLRAGIDVARGPEEWAFYLQFGSAWLMSLRWLLGKYTPSSVSGRLAQFAGKKARGASDANGYILYHRSHRNHDEAHLNQLPDLG